MDNENYFQSALFWIDDTMKGKEFAYWYSAKSSCMTEVTRYRCQHGTITIKVDGGSRKTGLKVIDTDYNYLFKVPETTKLLLAGKEVRINNLFVQDPVYNGYQIPFSLWKEGKQFLAVPTD